ncbi:MAG TPA: PEP/pyruvate-binding domain-containing protein [Thermoanaerobaculia bacterium]|nr:PEP/pyruvate-binding domain-containing protein [Thermoanaerobaculia bacterium]HUM30728.1 PEP/pyruvate-binding domain-containing protein [Thermoanaerobaculia bacterium]HXK68983.1 PEP/pyruvate-binding domain-containing protein [Thermoanaerobaculia bacterium]
MTESSSPSSGILIPPFDRKFFSGEETLTAIGEGELGGKAHGLAQIKDFIFEHFSRKPFPDIVVDVPRLTVITTRYFDLFMEQNRLYDLALTDLPDERMAHHFLKAALPPDLLGDLRALTENLHVPLAVRSSSLLEDSLDCPFAGVYETKMVPNNQSSSDERFRKLTEAVKFVYASTFFNQAKDYMRATGNAPESEKMAVIIQEVVGLRHGDRFYPNLAGVGRSYNFYPFGHAEPEDGVANLALGLGKSIVDGSLVWTYSPAYPNTGPPFNSINDMLKNTQTTFWAVNMGKPKTYNPLHETEYLIQSDLSEAEYDNTLKYVASTLDPKSGRISIGTGMKGPRIINFSPLLQAELIPFNDLLRSVLEVCESSTGAKVEIEFAMTFDRDRKGAGRFGLLQVRPMGVSDEIVELVDEEFSGDRVLLASAAAMGNGVERSLQTIVYVKPDGFDFKYTVRVARELEQVNRDLILKGVSYLLIGFGRWGSSDSWLGIPVNWGQISGSRVIVEATFAERPVDLSQGSHFFHNISNLQVKYLSVPAGSGIDWDWLKSQPAEYDGEFVRCVTLSEPLVVKVDGRSRKGVVRR